MKYASEPASRKIIDENNPDPEAESAVEKVNKIMSEIFSEKKAILVNAGVAGLVCAFAVKTKADENGLVIAVSSGTRIYSPFFQHEDVKPGFLKQLRDSISMLISEIEGRPIKIGEY